MLSQRSERESRDAVGSGELGGGELGVESGKERDGRGDSHEPQGPKKLSAKPGGYKSACLGIYGSTTTHTLL